MGLGEFGKWRLPRMFAVLGIAGANDAPAHASHPSPLKPPAHVKNISESDAVRGLDAKSTVETYRNNLEFHKTKILEMLKEAKAKSPRWKRIIEDGQREKYQTDDPRYLDRVRGRSKLAEAVDHIRRAGNLSRRDESKTYIEQYDVRSRFEMSVVNSAFADLTALGEDIVDDAYANTIANASR